MMRGGRMTYGFGYWRSGYTTLIPWHWRWVIGQDQFEYLRTKVSPCGMRMDEEGKIIPAIYWECFREGYDDERYLYTLQQTIEERKGLKECENLVNEGEQLLKNIWDSIKVQPMYLDTNVWASENFEKYRWQIACQISALKKYPPLREIKAPSVTNFITDSLNNQ